MYTWDNVISLIFPFIHVYIQPTMHSFLVYLNWVRSRLESNKHHTTTPNEP